MLTFLKKFQRRTFRNWVWISKDNAAGVGDGLVKTELSVSPMTKLWDHRFTHHTRGHESLTDKISEGTFLGYFQAIWCFTDVLRFVFLVLANSRTRCPGLLSLVNWNPASPLCVRFPRGKAFFGAILYTTQIFVELAQLTAFRVS